MHKCKGGLPGVPRQVFGLHTVSPFLFSLAKDPDILQTVKKILGNEIYLFQTRINHKEARVGKGYGWHSDYAHWHEVRGLKEPKVVLVSIYLDEQNEKNGALQLVPGSRHQPFFEDQYGYFSSDAGKSKIQKPSEKCGIKEVCGSRGSLLIMNAHVLHRSGQIHPSIPAEF